jgi:L-ribulose-5-phosphate 3-epimerase
MSSPFRVSVITDEITQDFEKALQIASHDFGLEWVEVRGMWNKNLLKMDASEIEEARKLLERYHLRVTDIASPLFKVDWPGAPQSKFSPKKDEFGANFTFDQQDHVLERSIELAKAFSTDRVRCFDFWRLDDQKPYRAAIDAKLLDAVQKAGKKGITLLLENEAACNTATGEEAGRIANAVRSEYFKLNWDAGNAAMHGETAYPDGYKHLPKKRIGHVHCKDFKPNADTKKGEWAPMGGGIIDWLGQFRALKRDGYHYAVSLETHWRGAGTPEASTRKSMEGMKDLLQRAGAA